LSRNDAVWVQTWLSWDATALYQDHVFYSYDCVFGLFVYFSQNVIFPVSPHIILASM